VSAELVLENGEPLDRVKGTTDVHLRGVPVIVPVKRPMMATRRGKAARRRANSRVMVSREYGTLNPPWER
jgi:hypothetical protein